MYSLSEANVKKFKGHMYYLTSEENVLPLIERKAFEAIQCTCY